MSAGQGDVEVFSEGVCDELPAARLMRVSRVSIDDKRLYRRVPVGDRDRTTQRFRAGEPDPMVVGLNVEDGRQRLGVLARLMELHDHPTAVVQPDAEDIADSRRPEQQLDDWRAKDRSAHTVHRFERRHS